MEKKDSSRPLLYQFQLKFHMQETFHKTLEDEIESAEEKRGEDAETALNEEYFSANLNTDEVVQKLRKMLGDKFNEEVKQVLLTPWFENVESMETSNNRTENKEESQLEEQPAEEV